MNNVEQEYCFKVTDLKQFIDYCENNGFTLISESEQVRKIYKKSDNTMLRITIDKKGDKIVKTMDFKQDLLSDEPLIERKESLPIEFEDDEAVKSIIDFLNYKESIELKRKRYVYNKDDIKIEMDEYISPEQAYVVAIEGNIEKSEIIYNELKDKYNEFYIINNKSI